MQFYSVHKCVQCNAMKPIHILQLHFTLHCAGKRENNWFCIIYKHVSECAVEYRAFSFQW